MIINPDLMQTLKSIKAVHDEVQNRMNKAIESVRREFQNLRTGRANVALVEGIEVLYYGNPTPLKGLASLSTPDPKSILIQPWDVNAVAEIEKAIKKSELGLNPVVEGKVIRVPVPPLTTERRNEISKLIKKIAEEGRVSVRNIRHEANETVKKLEKEKLISEDDVFSSQKEVQKITDKSIETIDQHLAKKEQDIKEV